jgi:hypothetical protein
MSTDSGSELVKIEKKLADEFEWKQSIETFTRSSDRGRYLLVFLVLASFFCTICWLNSRQESWIAGRVTHARQAIRYEVWNPKSQLAATKEFFDLKKWAEKYNLYSRELLMSYLSRLEDMESQSAYSVRIPIIGVSFDINDLGAVVGLSFLFLLLLLLASTYREHENLYLCLWKVERALDSSRKSKGRPDLGDSDVNLLYHSLAMAQVFANPPTLARWRRNRLYSLPYFIFFLPLVPEGLIFQNDLSTTQIAKQLSQPATLVSLCIQALAIVLCLVIAVFCVIYERAAAFRWRRTFYLINPKFRHLAQPRVCDWLLLSHSRPSVHSVVADEWLSKGGKKISSLYDLVNGSAALIFDSARHPQFSDEQLQKLLGHIAHDAWIRFAIDSDPALEDPGRYQAPKRFLRRWRANEVAFAVVEMVQFEDKTSGSEKSERELRITDLVWRWDERLEVKQERSGGQNPRRMRRSKAA